MSDSLPQVSCRCPKCKGSGHFDETHPVPNSPMHGFCPMCHGKAIVELPELETELCPQCSGTGIETFPGDCSRCAGTGKISLDPEAEIHLISKSEFKAMQDKAQSAYDLGFQAGLKAARPEPANPA